MSCSGQKPRGVFCTRRPSPGSGAIIWIFPRQQTKVSEVSEISLIKWLHRKSFAFLYMVVQAVGEENAHAVSGKSHHQEEDRDRSADTQDG